MFARTDAAGVRTHRHLEPRRQKRNRERLVDAADAAGVELADVNRPA
jgi:hypothetical protein